MLTLTKIDQCKYWLPGVDWQFQEPRILPTTNPYFTIFRPGQTRRMTPYRVDEAPDVLAREFGKPDRYMCQAFFRRPNNQKVNVSLFTHSWVDLDVYWSEYRDKPIESVKERILQFCDDENKTIPLPTEIVYSGRGLYIKYAFSSPIPGAAMPRVERLNKELVKIFASFGADQRATDASKVLRIAGSLHSESDEQVRKLWQLEVDSNAVAYDFNELCDEILPFTQAELKIKRETKQTTRCYYPNKITPEWKDWWWGVFSDINTLLELRGWLGSVPWGHRDEIAFAGAIALSWALDAHDAPSEIMAWCDNVIGDRFWIETQWRHYAATLIRKCKDSASGRKIEWNGKVVDPRYRPKRDWFVDRLLISDDEMQNLKCLISKDEKKRRQFQASGRITKDQKDSVKERIVEVYSATGKLPPGVCQRTVQRWRKEMSR